MLKLALIFCLPAGGIARLPSVPFPTTVGVRGGSLTHDTTQPDLNLQLAGKLMPFFHQVLSSAKLHGYTLVSSYSLRLALDVMVNSMNP